MHFLITEKGIIKSQEPKERITGISVMLKYQLQVRMDMMRSVMTASISKLLR